MTDNEHRLTKVGNEWSCDRCEWIWGNKPQSKCLGIPRYSWSNRPKNWLTKTELGRAGFKLSPDQKRKGFAQTGMGEKYSLYDIYEATKKRTTTWDPAEGLERLKAYYVSKEKREYEEKLTHKLYNIYGNIFANLIDDLIEAARNPDSFVSGREGYEVNVKKRCDMFRAASSEMRSHLKRYQRKFLPQPRPDDAVLGGSGKSPRPDDAVLGGETSDIH